MKPLALALLTGCTAAIAPVDTAADSGRWPAVVEPWEDYAGTGAEVGDALVPFVLPDQYGDEVDYRQFLGFVTVVVVDAAWSPHSQQSAGERQAFQDALQADHPTWVITVLTEQGVGQPPSPPDAAAWADLHGLVHTPVLADVQWALNTTLRVDAVPTVLVVAPDGTVRARITGSDHEAAVTAEVAAAAAAQAELLRPLP